MLVADVLRGFICYYLNAYYSGPLLNYPIMDQIKDVFPSYGLAVAIALPVYLLSYIPINNTILLFIQIFIGGFLAFVLCEKTKLPEYIEIKSIVMPYINKVYKK